MSRKKKMSHAQKMRARVARAVDPDMPPPQAIAAYQEVFEWSAENPHDAMELVDFDDEHWAGVLAGIAFPEKFGYPENEVIDHAWQLRAWNILHGFKYAFDWPDPIAMMSDQQIIDAIRQSAAEGKIGLAPE